MKKLSALLLSLSIIFSCSEKVKMTADEQAATEWSYSDEDSQTITIQILEKTLED